jgi:hypothetical protein
MNVCNALLFCDGAITYSGITHKSGAFFLLSVASRLRNLSCISVTDKDIGIALDV